MEPKRNKYGVIINAEELTADQVVHRRVLCPACRNLTFQMWPEGWDSHARTRCEGLTGSPRERKAEFRKRFAALFRDSQPTPTRLLSRAQREKAANAPLSGRERLDGDGVITNAAELNSEELKMRRVWCPACQNKVFVQWPSGWDGHASYACSGMKAKTPEARRAEYQKRFGKLFPERKYPPRKKSPQEPESLAPVQRNDAGVIVNAQELEAAQVVHQRVLCPACQTTVLAMWPEGWDVHAARYCTALHGDPGDRKAEFKERFRKLFRK